MNKPSVANAKVNSHSGMGGAVGLAHASLTRSMRRRIMAALRMSCRVLGIGQKSRLGSLGMGAVVGAIAAVSLAAPAAAQTVLGGGTATATGATTAIVIGGAGDGAATGSSPTKAYGNGAVAIGTNATVSQSGGYNTGGIAIGNASVGSMDGIAIGTSYNDTESSSAPYVTSVASNSTGSIAIGPKNDSRYKFRSFDSNGIRYRYR